MPVQVHLYKRPAHWAFFCQKPRQSYSLSLPESKMCINYYMLIQVDNKTITNSKIQP